MLTNEQILDWAEDMQDPEFSGDPDFNGLVFVADAIVFTLARKYSEAYSDVLAAAETLEGLGFVAEGGSVMGVGLEEEGADEEETAQEDAEDAEPGSARETAQEDDGDIPISEDLIEKTSLKMNPTNKINPSTLINQLRKGYRLYHEFIELLESGNELNESKIEVKQARRWVLRYRQYEGVYKEPGILSFTRLQELEESGQMKRMYGIGITLAGVLHEVLQSVRPKPETE